MTKDEALERYIILRRERLILDAKIKSTQMEHGLSTGALTGLFDQCTEHTEILQEEMQMWKAACTEQDGMLVLSKERQERLREALNISL
jgi:hypothetical protein